MGLQWGIDVTLADAICPIACSTFISRLVVKSADATVALGDNSPTFRWQHYSTTKAKFPGG